MGLCFFVVDILCVVCGCELCPFASFNGRLASRFQLANEKISATPPDTVHGLDKILFAMKFMHVRIMPMRKLKW